MANKRPIIAGISGSEFLSVLNTKGIYNVLDYSIVADDSTDNTSAIQALVNSVHSAGGGYLYFPSGTYQTGTISLYVDTPVIGDGFSSVIKSNSAAILLQMSTDIPYGFVGKLLSNITLNGNSLGTKGFYGKLNAWFDLQEVYVHHFTQYGMHLNGCLVGTMSNCHILHNGIGLYFDGAGGATNLVNIKDCTFQLNTTWGIKWEKGLMVIFTGCDIEDNGQEGDLDTGGIYYKYTGSSGDQNLGLILNNCWIESNHGRIIYLVDSPSANIFNQFINCQWIGNEEVPTYYDIYIDGTTSTQRLILSGCILKDGNNLYIKGNSATVINTNSFLKGSSYTHYGYGGITISDSGKYIYQNDWLGNTTVPLFSGNLTDDTPSDAEIDAVTGLTPVIAKAGYKCTILDTNGSGCLYFVQSDGTNWQYVKMTIAT